MEPNDKPQEDDQKINAPTEGASEQETLTEETHNEHVDTVPEEETPKQTSNVTLTRETERPITDKDKFHPQQMLYALLETPKAAAAFQEALERLEMSSGESVMKWINAIREGDQVLLSGDALSASLKRDGSDWQQAVEHNGEQLVAGRPRYTAANSGGKLEGGRAVLKIQALLGGGEPIQIPLWHSGLWISLKTPKNSAVATTSDLILQEKCNFGRTTNGLIFSNATVFIVKHLVDLIIDHVYDCSLKDWTPELLRSIILSEDLPALALGLLNTQYPTGYPYSRPCIASPSSCQHTMSALLHLGKISWVDRNALTMAQKDHMAKRRERVTLEQVKTYQDTFKERSTKAVYTVKEGLKVTFKSPSLEEYIANGYDWIESIVRMTDDAFDRPLSRNERERHIQDHATLERCRQYAHWLSKVVITEEDGGETYESVIEDSGTLESVVDAMSQSDESADGFFDAVRNYIDDTTVSLVGIPQYSCPQCNMPQEVDPKHPEIIPIDVVRTFFTLANQKLSLALNPGS